MTKRIQRSLVAIAALAALALGGSAIASAQTGAKHAKAVHHAARATDQSGDQNAPDPKGSSESASENSAEQPSSAEGTGSESTTNSDGPGGHADEPGNANADHQFQGQE